MAPRKRVNDIPNHSHCIMCGAVVPKSELLCSDQCKDKYARMEKRQKNMRFAALFCAVFAIAVFAVLLLLRGK